jgi:G:T/U-mismatch repair DNA glycosylase
MLIEHVQIGGRRVTTLAELLRPGLRAVVVGINPSPVSVKVGHYYQGRYGKVLWKRLQAAGILHDLEPGAEDEGAFQQGFGFADVLREPTPNAT